MTGRIGSLSLLFSLLSTYAFADDVGIAEVRLIEEEKYTYALEVDISPYLLNTIGTPILPDRCTFIDAPEKVDIGPMLVVRYRFTSGTTALQSGDELILFWRRSGIVLTAYWLDGTSKRVFFDRGLAGIRIQVSRLREINKSQFELLSMGIAEGFTHLSSKWLLHALLVLASALFGSVRRMACLLLAFSGGQGISLVATDLGVSGLFPEGIPVLMGVVALMIFAMVFRNRMNDQRIWLVFLIIGLLHGLGYSGPDFDQQVVLSPLLLITARFGFNLMIDLTHLLCGVLLWGIIILDNRFHSVVRIRQAAMYLGGSLSITAILIFLPNALALQSPGAKVGNVSIPSQNSVRQTIARTASRPVAITDPVVGFLTVTPFEIRCEWLIRARDFSPPTEINESGEAVIPLKAQTSFKNDLLEQFVKQTILTVDGRQIEVSETRTDFVTVASYGVSTRSSATDEHLEQAAIGLSLAYAVNEAPSDVTLSMFDYSGLITSIPVTFTDPWGSTPHVLTDTNPRAGWKRRMAGFRRPLIKAVQIDPVTWPWASLLSIFPAVGILFFIRRGWRKDLAYGLILICALIAIGSYPFVRVDMPSALTSPQPADEETHRALGQMLTNIYRAFDYKTEEAIYDRLAISATGDQLADIYLQHRSAMEIENRGGARASVDKVDILDIDEIKTTEDGLKLNAAWMVSGSVNHFGHIHYRKNRYEAIVHIISNDGMWKISGIEVVEEERVL